MKYTPSDDSCWGANIKGSQLEIYWCKTNHPGAALAHELLHAAVQISGYKRLRISFSAIDQGDRFRNLTECLDNELQHHKMFGEFISMGFQPHEFYCDEDVQVFEHLKGVIASRSFGLLDLLPHFLTLLAPGGILTSEQKAELDHDFKTFRGGQFKNQLIAVEQAIRDWSASPNFDTKPTLKEILIQLKNPCLTWFGHSSADRPPRDGFFVDQPFTVISPNA